MTCLYFVESDIIVSRLTWEDVRMPLRLFKRKQKLPRTIEIQNYYGEAKPLTIRLSENIDILNNLMGEPSDLIVRKFNFGGKQEMAIIFISVMTNQQIIQMLIDKLLLTLPKYKAEHFKDEEVFEWLKDETLPASNVQEIQDFNSLSKQLLDGNTVLLIDGYPYGLSLATKGSEDRGITESKTESVIIGPKDSFNETLSTNIMLIRRRIKDINLRILDRELGTVTKTRVSVLYMEGIANEEIVQNLIQRLDLIDIDGILESSYIEELILDEPNSIFPTMQRTERPDRVVANLLEGRIAVLVDGTPIALILPAIFYQFFHAVEDYYLRPVFASFIRLVRFGAFFVSLLLPAVYIALTTFHQEMIPTILLINIAGQREIVPLPAMVEAILMEFTFESLREAGLRMPNVIGNAISIVGALVIGEAAVNAGIVSNIMVIVVAFTAITTLIFPEHSIANPIRLLRFIFIFLSGMFGLYGITGGLFILALHLCGLRSFGVPYMYPLAPLNLKDLRDIIFRFPISKMDERPNLISGQDNVRQSEGQAQIPQVAKKGK